MENNKLQIFKFENKRVRTTEVNGEPYFCLADICRILGIGNTTNVAKRLDLTGFYSIKSCDINGLGIEVETKTLYIDESNLYKCIMTSRKKEAEKFQNWITKEVLPSIRKTGAYITNKDVLVLEAMKYLTGKVEILEKEVTFLESANKKNIKQLEKAKPKVDFYDQVTGDDEDIIELNNVSKVLNMGIGRNGLYQILRDHNILMANNIPYQYYIDRGYFRVVEKMYKKNGKVFIELKTMVYQKGINYIRKFLTKLGARRRAFKRRDDDDLLLFSTN